MQKCPVELRHSCPNTPIYADRLMRLEEVLCEIGLKKTPFYSMIKEFDEAYKTEQNEKIKEEIFSIYILIKQKK